MASFKNVKKYIVIKDGYDEIKLNHDDILYIKSDNTYVDIITTSKKYAIRNSLDSFLKELDNETFCKVHRSYIVNTSKITKKGSNAVFLGTIQIPISRNFVIKL